MILYSVNDALRDTIYSLFEGEVFEYIQTLDDKEQERVIKLIVSDALKILETKVKKSRIVMEDSKILYQFLKNTKYEELKVKLEDNIELFYKLYTQGKQFYQLPVIDRCLLLRLQVLEGTAREIGENDPSIILDSMVYTLQKDLEAINYYYQDYKNKVGNNNLSSFYLLVLSLLDELRTESNQAFEDNYSEIIKNFYMFYRYVEFAGSTPITEGAVPKSLIEREPIQAAKELIYSVPSLFCEVLAYHLSYISDDLVDKEEVKTYAKNNISDKMKRKLKIF